jgi:hypothetical protein
MATPINLLASLGDKGAGALSVVSVRLENAGIGVMLAVSVWGFVSPANRRCEHSAYAISAREACHE